MRRRDFLKLGGVAVASSGLAAPAVAQAGKWPDKPVRMIVPFAAGGATDLLARPWAEKLTHAFGQQFVIENRGGASGLIGAEAVAKAAPDGYTFLFSGNSATVTQPLLRKINFDPKAMIAMARMGDAIAGFAINPTVGPKTFPEMIDYAKRNPGKLNYASTGLGTSPHLRYEMLRLRTGVDIHHIPYRGGADIIQDLLANTVQMMNEGSALPHAKAGKLILLNVNHPERFAPFPNVPTLTELGITGADCPTWFTLYAPPGTPREIAEMVNAKANAIALTKEMLATMEVVSAVPVVQSLDEIKAFWDNDTVRMAALLKEANVKVE